MLFEGGTRVGGTEAKKGRADERGLLFEAVTGPPAFFVSRQSSSGWSHFCIVSKRQPWMLGYLSAVCMNEHKPGEEEKIGWSIL